MSNKIKRIPVDSSMLSAIGYDAKEKILYAEFANTGNIYVYEGVPKKEFDNLKNADSLGRYMRGYFMDCYPDYQVRRRDFRW